MLSTDIAKAQVRISLNQCFIFYMNSYKQNSKINFLYEFIHLFSNNIQLTRECILLIEKFQVTMQDKVYYIAFYERSQITLSFDAMTTSPCEAMNSHIKEKMGCSSNTNTSKSLMFMAKGAIQCIEEFEKNFHRELQNSSLCSKLVVKDDVTRECLYLCNQNFDRRQDYMCVQCSKDDWMYGILTVRNPMIPSHQIIIHSLCQSSRMYIMFMLRDS
jgi:hypothetical protein